MNVLARLAPGVTAAEARADLERMLPIWLDAWPIVPGSTLTKEAIANWQIAPVVRPLKDDLVGGVASTLWVLMGAIGAVLLIACANIANLLLVRAEARRQEFAVRAALGAVPARIARELLVESLVLGAAGSVARLGARLRWSTGSRCDRSEQLAAPRRDRRPCARARVHGGDLACVDRSCSARSRHSSTRCRSIRP